MLFVVFSCLETSLGTTAHYKNYSRKETVAKYIFFASHQFREVFENEFIQELKTKGKIENLPKKTEHTFCYAKQ